MISNDIPSIDSSFGNNPSGLTVEQNFEPELLALNVERFERNLTFLENSLSLGIPNLTAANQGARNVRDAVFDAVSENIGTIDGKDAGDFMSDHLSGAEIPSGVLLKLQPFLQIEKAYDAFQNTFYAKDEWGSPDLKAQQEALSSFIGTATVVKNQL